MKKIYKLNPEKNLTHQWSFWLINGVLFLFAMILICIIVCKGDYSPDWSPKGFKLFLSDFGFPISILALIIPASALIATMHRSTQLSTQINLLMNQNNFANYYKHLEEFEKYINAEILEREKELIEGGTLKVYRCCFPETRNGIYDVNSRFVAKLERITKSIFDDLHEAASNGGKMNEILKIFNDHQQALCNLCGIGFYYFDVPSVMKAIPQNKEANVEQRIINNMRSIFIHRLTTIFIILKFGIINTEDFLNSQKLLDLEFIDEVKQRIKFI